MCFFLQTPSTDALVTLNVALSKVPGVFHGMLTVSPSASPLGWTSELMFWPFPYAAHSRSSVRSPVCPQWNSGLGDKLNNSHLPHWQGLLVIYADIPQSCHGRDWATGLALGERHVGGREGMDVGMTSRHSAAATAVWVSDRLIHE